MNNRNTMPCNKVNGNSNIPLRKQLARQSSTPSTPSKIPVNDTQAHRWKQKFEEAEERRKLLLTEKEKALRNLNEVEKKYLHLQIKHEHLETELFEKNEEFTKLSTASKNLYKEYETLKNQYETETRAMSGALKDASQWYKENKALKRKTLLLMDKDAVDEGVDAGDGESTLSDHSDTDIDNLNRTIKQLSTEVAELQTEVDSLKHSEFQILEENTKLTEDLENEKLKNERLESVISELKREHEQILRVTDMMKKELEEQKNVEEELRNSLAAVKKESDHNKKERNVLAHQSTLILQGLNENSEGVDCMILLQEIEELKRGMEDEKNRYEEEISLLQDRIEDEVKDAQIEILEERLKLAESELQAETERADRAEEKLRAPPPPPPPPPPPLFPPPPLVPPVVPLRRRRSKIAIADLAETIGVQDCISPEKKPAAPGVNEDIINAIKAGQFTLRKARSEKEKKDKEQPKAVSELLNILGSLRRAPKKRQSQYIGDVQL